MFVVAICRHNWRNNETTKGLANPNLKSPLNRQVIANEVTEWLFVIFTGEDLCWNVKHWNKRLLIEMPVYVILAAILFSGDWYYWKITIVIVRFPPFTNLLSFICSISFVINYKYFFSYFRLYFIESK